MEKYAISDGDDEDVWHDDEALCGGHSRQPELSNMHSTRQSSSDKLPPIRPQSSGFQTDKKDQPITAEDRRFAMLGFKTKPGADGKPGTIVMPAIFTREEFCSACGQEHLNPKLLDMYPNCKACCYPLREAFHLQKRFIGKEPKYPLEILFATYGDPQEPMIARECTEVIQQMVVDSYFRFDRLVIKAAFKLDVMLGYVISTLITAYHKLN